MKNQPHKISRQTMRTALKRLLVSTSLGVSICFAVGQEVLKPIVGGLNLAHFARANVKVEPSRTFHIGLSLKNIRQSEADEFVQSLYDPKSPNFHHFITQPEYGNRFGAPEADVAAVSSYLQSKGFDNIDVSENRLFVRAEGSEERIEAAFHIHVISFVRPDAEKKGLPGTFYAPDRDPQVPEGIARLVTAVHGLTNYFQPVPAHHKR
jgi:subtilase family serine protease